MADHWSAELNSNFQPGWILRYDPQDTTLEQVRSDVAAALAERVSSVG